MSDTNLTLDYFEFCRNKYKELSYPRNFVKLGHCGASAAFLY